MPRKPRRTFDQIEIARLHGVIRRLRREILAIDRAFNKLATDLLLKSQTITELRKHIAEIVEEHAAQLVVLDEAAKPKPKPLPNPRGA